MKQVIIPSIIAGFLHFLFAFIYAVYLLVFIPYFIEMFNGVPLPVLTRDIFELYFWVREWILVIIPVLMVFGTLSGIAYGNIRSRASKNYALLYASLVAILELGMLAMTVLALYLPIRNAG